MLLVMHYNLYAFTDFYSESRLIKPSHLCIFRSFRLKIWYTQVYTLYSVSHTCLIKSSSRVSKISSEGVIVGYIDRATASKDNRGVWPA